VLFDGQVEEAVAQARSQWKAIKAAAEADAGTGAEAEAEAEAEEGASGANHVLSYWQQNDRGGWVQAQ